MFIIYVYNIMSIFYMYLGQWGVFLGPIKQTVLTGVYALRSAAEFETFAGQGKKKHFIRRDGFSDRTQTHVQLQ